jgi:hypothetical protein
VFVHLGEHRNARGGDAQLRGPQLCGEFVGRGHETIRPQIVRCNYKN